MALTQEEKRTLIQRYEYWGVDQVRAQVENPDHRLLASPEMVGFARSWVRQKENETERHYKRLLTNVLLTIGAALLVVIGIGFYLG